MRALCERYLAALAASRLRRRPADDDALWWGERGAVGHAQISSTIRALGVAPLIAVFPARGLLAECDKAGTPP
mgnify:CR=1 FL=1